MPNINNLVIQGTYFVPEKIDDVTSLKKVLIKYLVNKGYHPENTHEIFSPNQFLTINFRMNLPTNPPSILEKIKKLFGLLSEFDLELEPHLKRLKTLRYDFVLDIKFQFTPGTWNSKEGIIVNVSTIPVAYYIIHQINKNLYLSQDDQNSIVFTGSELIKEVMTAILAKPIDGPKPISRIFASNLAEKLLVYHFSKINKLLLEGQKNLDSGQDSIPELIGIIENFLYELVARFSESPFSLDKPEKNIEKLKTLNLIDTNTAGDLQKILFNGVYSRLKDRDHKKEPISYFEMKLYYGVTQEVIDYLIERTLHYKLKYSSSSPTTQK